jgi:hypothetical protein
MCLEAAGGFYNIGQPTVQMRSKRNALGRNVRTLLLVAERLLHLFGDIGSRATERTLRSRAMPPLLFRL